MSQLKEETKSQLVLIQILYLLRESGVLWVLRQITSDIKTIAILSPPVFLPSRQGPSPLLLKPGLPSSPPCSRSCQGPLHVSFAEPVTLLTTLPHLSSQLGWRSQECWDCLSPSPLNTSCRTWGKATNGALGLGPLPVCLPFLNTPALYSSSLHPSLPTIASPLLPPQGCLGREFWIPWSLEYLEYWLGTWSLA